MATHARNAMAAQKRQRNQRIERRRSEHSNSTAAKRTVSGIRKLFHHSADKHTGKFDPSTRTLDAALLFANLFRAKDLKNMHPKQRAAIRIQRHWRVTERLRQVRYRSHQIRIRVNSILIYVLFLIAHYYSTIWTLSVNDNFHFVNNLKGQLGDAEFNTEDAPTWGKNFFDIATLLETNQWLRGPFRSFIASHSTFDGDHATPIVDTTSYALGYGRIVGGVRIGQLRGPRILCGAQKAAYTFGASLDVDAKVEKVHCYPEFSVANEVKASFRSFEWEGWNGTSTSRERKQLFTSETIFKSYRSYPSPAYSVVLSPTNWTSSISMLSHLEKVHYIDVHTRVLFVDILVYNPTLDYLANCRMVVQFTPAGGAMATFKTNSVPSSPIPFTGGWSTTASISEMVIITFYLYFFCMELLYIMKFGVLDYFESADLAKIIHLLNIFL